VIHGQLGGRDMKVTVLISPVFRGNSLRTATLSP
jgi:hypothetical protein